MVKKIRDNLMKKLKFDKDGNVVNYVETIRDDCKDNEFEESSAFLKRIEKVKDYIRNYA